MFKIDKGIPIPTAGTIRNKEKHAALRMMEVGDSLEFKTDLISGSNAAYSKSLVTLISLGKRTYNYKFTQRLSDDRKKVRVWRIA